MDAIRAKRWKTIGYVLRQPEELHDNFIKGIIEQNKTAARTRNCWRNQKLCKS